MYLKTVVLVLLGLIIVGSGIFGALLVLVGMFGSLYNNDACYLALLIPGIYCGFMCFVALDALEHINDKWSWKV
jgi:hypothetical protein